MRDYIVVLLAGAEAQAKFEGRPVAEVVGDGGPAADYEYAGYHAENLEPPSVTPVLFDYLNARTRDLVEVHRFLIEALANELVLRRTLSGVTANRRIREAIQRVARGTEWDEGHWESLTPYGWRQLADLIGRFGLRGQSGFHSEVVEAHVATPKT